MAKAQEAELVGAERTIGTLQWVIGLLFSLIIVVSGALVGVWSRDLEREVHEFKADTENEHRDFHRILDARADLPNRTTQLEARIQRLEELKDFRRRLH